MASKTTETQRRSDIAKACLDFGSHLLNVRISSVTADDAQRHVADLFDWFASHDAFTEANAEIAIHAIQFGEQLLATRKTATVQEAIEAIQQLFGDLAA